MISFIVRKSSWMVRSGHLNLSFRKCYPTALHHSTNIVTTKIILHDFDNTLCSVPNSAIEFAKDNWLE
jgi:hypothetical protein